ncbi:hypothetical protein K469DRAFT_682104 [Zopfia rhizophila CBS 207.26]|uniref:Uncharacterized protein n=1 Tax=Zopfia rhizophila CBS 207.26 TaxID=1314779 RepID=A0A6A6EWD1_9PEZI|nr:hypothetical protein K469DRAFT_682104 [Zopfia rhizophila CBS 207.26]
MTDPEELDEDLFADLMDSYEGDDVSSKPAQPAPAVRAEEPNPVKSEVVEESMHDTVSNGAIGADSSAPMRQGPGDDGGDMDMNGSAWNGNATQGYDHTAIDDDNYGPINVKEDG